MAYISQETKKAMLPKIKAICQKYGIKVSLSIDNYSSITCTIASWRLPSPLWENDTRSVNTFYIDNHFEWERRELLKEINEVLHGEGRYDESDAMTDYFNTARYVHIGIWKWDKPYKQI